MHPVSGLISSRSAHAGCVGMATPCSCSPPHPGATLCRPSTPCPQRHPSSTRREQLRFPPSGSSLQIQLPNVLLLTRRLNGNIWALSLCSPLPLHGRETFTVVAWVLPGGIRLIPTTLPCRTSGKGHCRPHAGPCSRTSMG